MDACPRWFFRVKIFCTRLAMIVATLCFRVWNRKQLFGISCKLRATRASDTCLSSTARLAGSYFLDMKMPGALPVVLSAFVLLIAAVVASWLPAARAARIDVIQALRAE
jgi:ABC-type antimicrobial peptide transport system permease subunit